MREIVILDTSILLNLLAVPGKDQDRLTIEAEFLALHQRGGLTLLVPMAAIVETGNHIGQLADGGRRRQCAERMVKMVRSALRGEAPFALADVDAGRNQLDAMLEAFPNWASCGSGWGDLSIQHSWQRTCSLFGDARVRVWSLDRHLAAYDHQP